MVSRSKDLILALNSGSLWPGFSILLNLFQRVSVSRWAEFAVDRHFADIGNMFDLTPPVIVPKLIEGVVSGDAAASEFLELVSLSVG